MSRTLQAEIWSPCLHRPHLPTTRPAGVPQPKCWTSTHSQSAKHYSSLSAYSGRVEFSGNSGRLRFSEEPANIPAPTIPLKDRWKSWMAESRRLRSRLNSYGVSGLLAYGLLNTLYYTMGFLIVWLYFAKVPRGLGWSEVTKQFATVMGLTWAASQITKVPRAALALFLAPTADGILIYVQARCRLRTRRNALVFLVAACFLLAAVVFGGCMALWL